MGRPLRLLDDDLTYHALNRGNNRGPVFFTPDDYRSFLLALRRTKDRYPFRLYGYCLMGNHFHLVLRPDRGQSISRILQSLTVAHTWHYHRGHGTTSRIAGPGGRTPGLIVGGGWALAAPMLNGRASSCRAVA